MNRADVAEKLHTNRQIKPSVICLGLLFFITLAVYWNSFYVPFQFDDAQTVSNNSNVRFGEYSLNLISGRGLLYFTFAMNYKLSGMSVWSYHVVNFLLHIINGWLVFFIGRSVWKDNYRFPFFAAAFFLVHPVQTESVTYISSRSELLSTCFYLAGLLLFIHWKWRRGVIYAIVVGALYILGLGTKETVITLPAVVLLFDLCFLNQVRKNWRFYAVYVAAVLTIGYYLLFINHSLLGSVGAHVPGNLSNYSYFLTETRVICTYIRLIIWPVDQNLDYDYPVSSSVFELEVIWSIAVILSLCFVGWRSRNTMPVVTLSVFWFLITLSPTSSVIPIRDVIFEHRLYLPMVGVSLSFPVVIDKVSGWLRS